MDRRSFIKLTAVTGAGATLADCGSPEAALIRFVPDDELVPGVAEWKPSICPLCPAGCGVTVRVMEADVEVVRGGQLGVVKMGVAKKLEGNPAHPISQGALCARGQAAIQVTYHPDRIQQPLKRSGARGDGRFQPITWDEALAELVARLDALRAENSRSGLRVLTRTGRSQRNALIAGFLQRFGAPPPVTFDLFDEAVLRRANALSFGRQQLPTFDLARTRCVFSFGADFLGTWNSPVAHGAAYGEMRQGRPGLRGRLIQFESRMSQTGANGDEWVPLKPGTEGVLALGFAHVIVRDRLRRPEAAGRAGELIEGWTTGLTDYTPEWIEQRTGVAARRVERLAREFAEPGPAVAIIGGAPLAHTNGLFSALAVNALSALVGSVGTPGGIFFTPQLAVPDGAGSSLSAPARANSIDRLAADILSGSSMPVQVMLIDQVNPVFAAPLAWNVGEALERIPFIAAFGNFLDETSILSDLILPDHSFLESWVDGVPESGATIGVANVAPPVMRPLYQTRPMPDVLLEIGRRLSQPLEPPLPWQTYEEMLGVVFAGLPSKEGGDGWATAQERGGWWGELPSGRDVAPDAGTQPSRVFMYLEPQLDGPSEQYPFYFLPYPSPSFLDGSLAHLPWLQELPDPLTSAMWSSWVEINPATAGSLAIAQGDVIEVTSRHGSVQAAALISPGLAPDVIAMPVGQGHRTFTRVASGRGENPIAMLAPLVEPETGALAWAATRVRVSRVGDPDGRLILFAGGMHEHPQAEQGR